MKRFLIDAMTQLRELKTNTHLVSTHLLQHIRVLNSQVVPVELRRQARPRVLEVDVRPLLHILRAPVRLAAVTCVRAGLVRREGVVELRMVV